MQNNNTRNDARPKLAVVVSQKRNNLSVQSSRSEVMQKARQTMLDALEQHPKSSAIALAELLTATAEPEQAAKLNQILTTEFYARTIRSIRQTRAIAERALLKLPGFEHLPLTIPGPDGTPIPLVDASYTRVRAYYWSLMRTYSERKRKDPRIQEAKRLMETMREHAAHDKAITVRDVVLV